ncbi:MAG: (2Fe-2S)-binding protein [Spirochaetota bacterium]|nr:MAG: (2Fe-2S)-binding protein [Spirochaetota bacterium]
MEINFILNGKGVKVKTHPLRRLLDVLREDFDLSGVKEGCGEGECGACAVLVDGELALSCITPVGSVEGTSVVTIEGYRETAKYRALEEAFSATGAVQCGFCTPGFIIAAESLLSKTPRPTPNEIREAISGNLCRCTGYSGIVEGIKRASERGEGLW